MNNFMKISVIIMLCFTGLALKAQEAPIPNSPITVESFFGHRALTYQMIAIKKMQSVPRLGFLGISNFQATWDTPTIDDYVHQGNVTVGIASGLDISAGFIWEPFTGIRPSAGFIYSYANSNLLVITNPRMDMAKNPNADILVLIEYIPELSQKLRLYTRVQGQYGYNFGHEIHTRSYLMLRAGLTFGDFTVGLAKDFDYFGPEKSLLHNTGGFIRFELF